MKKIAENIIILGFVLFFSGGIIQVAIQSIGLVLMQEELVTAAQTWFSWIFPVSSVTGLLCFLYGYWRE